MSKKTRSQSKGKPTIVKEHQKSGIMAKSKSELQSQLQVALDKVFDMTKMDISKELMSKKYTNQNLQNQKIMKDAVENNEEIK